MKNHGRRHRALRPRAYAAAAIAAAIAAAVPGTASALTAATARPADLILLTNPGAEDGPGAPGWTGTPGFTTTPYGAAGEYPVPSISAALGHGGPIGGGTAFFDPGYEPNAVLTQVVDLARHQPGIASGAIDELGFTAWLGGYEASPDTVDLQVTPLDANGAPLSAPARVHGPSAAERGNTTTLVQRMGRVALPPATTAARVELIATGQPGQKNHGYSDEIILWLAHGWNGTIPAKLAGAPEAEDHKQDLPDPTYRGRAPVPSVTFARKAAIVSKRGKQLIVQPRAIIRCPRRGTDCTFRITVARGNETIGSKSLTLSPGKRAVPTVPLRRPATAALVNGTSIRAKIVVTADIANDGIDPISEARTARLALPKRDK